MWEESGISSTAVPWHPCVIFQGVLLGVVLELILIPFLVPLVTLFTIFDCLRWMMGADGRRCRKTDAVADSEDDVTLVLPGLCCYCFWQLGMLQYIAEQFDTSSVRLAGISSGAIGSVFLLSLEDAAAQVSSEAAAIRVRRRAHEVFQMIEKVCAPVVRHPLGFISRMGNVLDSMSSILPDKVPGSRLRIGVRRLSTGPFPALVPAVIDNIESRSELLSALQATSTVWLVVRAWPFTYVDKLGAYCADGVNVFSCWWILEFIQQWWDRTSERTAPAHAHDGLFSYVYAAFNCGTMEHLLQPIGRMIWVTPTVGAHLDVRNCARFSGWFIAEQWRNGYAHARELDSRGYFSALQRRSNLQYSRSW